MMSKAQTWVWEISDRLAPAIGSQMKALRKALGVTQLELAQRMTQSDWTMSHSGVSRLEARGPTKLARGIALLAFWIKALGGTKEDLYQVLQSAADRAWSEITGQPL